MATDREYLVSAVKGQVLCPNCGKAFLKFRVCERCTAAVCPECIAHFYTYQNLFSHISKSMGWPAGSWGKWLAAHPDYVFTEDD